MDWQWIGSGMTMDWHCGRGLAGLAWQWRYGMCEIILRWDTSVGPYSILVPRLEGQLSSDWHRINIICANACQCTANWWQSSFHWFVDGLFGGWGIRCLAGRVLTLDLTRMERRWPIDDGLKYMSKVERLVKYWQISPVLVDWGWIGRLVKDWHWIGRLVRYWYWICILGTDWRIGPDFADWSYIGIVLVFDWYWMWGMFEDCYWLGKLVEDCWNGRVLKDWFRIGSGLPDWWLVMEWRYIGDLMLCWRICPGLALDWKISLGLVSDWQWIDRLVLNCRIGLGLAECWG